MAGDAVTWVVHTGDNLDALRQMPDCSVDAVVTDPPYGLGTPPDAMTMLRAWLDDGAMPVKGRGFMGKEWDAFVPQPATWREVYRVLKPGGHLLTFAGTRTQDLMALSLRIAGFEIRDMLGWLYGCLSDDSEVLTRDGWERYHSARTKEILAYDPEADIYQWERPSRWNEYRVESDTAYRLQSDHTDQIVSRGHRCLVERGGALAFVPADELAGMERVPYLQGDVPPLPKGRGELLLTDVLRQRERLAEAALGERQGKEAARQGACWGEESGVEGRADVLQAKGEVRRPIDQVRSMPGTVCGHVPQGRLRHGASTGGGDAPWEAAVDGGVRAPYKPRRDGQQAGKPDVVCVERGPQAVRARPTYQTTLATVTAVRYTGVIFCPTVSTGAFVARRAGKVFLTGNSGFPKSLDVSKAIDKMDASEEQERRRLRFTAWVRSTGVTSRQIDEATGTNMGGHYTTPASQPAIMTLEHLEACRHLFGDVPEWVERECSIRSVESRNMAEREVVGQQRGSLLAVAPGQDKDRSATTLDITAPATDAARQWTGWGTALKPAIEPITLARKPLDGTVAANVLKWGTGALNVDGCRVDGEDLPEGRTRHGGGIAGNASSYELPNHKAPMPAGRWPANLLHDGSDEVEAVFPDDASRFFYSAKTAAWEREIGLQDAQKRTAAELVDRDADSAGMANPRAGAGRTSAGRANSHPTVKGVDVMRWLVRLVTPPGGTVLDPYTGSGTTGMACILEGFAFIGCELSAEYADIARARIAATEARQGVKVMDGKLTADDTPAAQMRLL